MSAKTYEVTFFDGRSTWSSIVSAYTIADARTVARFAESALATVILVREVK